MPQSAATPGPAPEAELVSPQKKQWAARFIYQKRSSRDPRARQPDYLADLFRRSYVRTIQESEGQLLDSTTAWFVGSDAAFYMLRSNSCIEAKRSVADAEADGINGIVFDYVLSGVYSETVATGVMTLGPGDLALVQSTVEVIARSRQAHVASIFIPRYRIAEVLGTDASSADFTLRALTASPLAPFAAAHIRLLAEHYGKMAPNDFDLMLDSIATLLLMLLRKELEAAAPRKDTAGEIFSRALAHMEQHYKNRDMTPEEIGQAIGVSRARLYKLFGQNNLTVSGYLRDLRLRHFVDDLRTADEASIGRIAWNCGFAMQSADFARVFKRTYGMTPRDALAALRAGRQVRPLSDAQTLSGSL